MKDLSEEGPGLTRQHITESERPRISPLRAFWLQERGTNSKHAIQGRRESPPSLPLLFASTVRELLCVRGKKAQPSSRKGAEWSASLEKVSPLPGWPHPVPWLEVAALRKVTLNFTPQSQTSSRNPRFVYFYTQLSSWDLTWVSSRHLTFGQKELFLPPHWLPSPWPVFLVPVSSLILSRRPSSWAVVTHPIVWAPDPAGMILCFHFSLPPTFY